jgi:hypothetical protein
MSGLYGWYMMVDGTKLEGAWGRILHCSKENQVLCYIDTGHRVVLALEGILSSLWCLCFAKRQHLHLEEKKSTMLDVERFPIAQG